eukprot:CAMPEP_0168790060 /NCGR_PEP_ID=MMETSP0725-20121227/13191_1 /TAXON_ID=265536 /ORGANISM="Amphiprora sp., Strain CCMP467" /LENGTH=2014 /DNA_ID=CAMNT_0008840425 /DNA_START=198 /DNA_END=6242 /DNA_ORIENTATION=+
MSRRRRDEDDGLSDDEDDDDDDDEIVPPSAKKRKKSKGGFVDDAAVESGDEDDEDDDEDEDGDEDNNEYEKDGFVVGEDEVDKKEKDDLEDSDDDDDDDDDEDEGKKKEARKKKRLVKMKKHEQLADDDLDLIREAQGLGPRIEERDAMEEEDRPVEHIKARNADELGKGLFYESDGERSPEARRAVPKKATKPRGDLYDEDGMDDFIEDDIGDQGDIRASERRGMGGEEGDEVNEAQLHEASEIFGTDYLDFINRDDQQMDAEEDELMGRGSKYREKGVGVDYGIDSDDQEEDDDDDLFDADDDEGMDGLTAQQKDEALKLKREKAKLARQERRSAAARKKAEKRKAQLRRVFEPVQLIENFCTDRDDAIRQTDVPERLFDWKTHFYGSTEESDPMTDTERTQAEWIVQRIPDVAVEHSAAATDEDRENILTSIVYALRYFHQGKLEPAFIKRYRKDYVTSVAVRNHLNEVMDEDSEFDRIVKAREKVLHLLSTITSEADGDAATGADSDRITELRTNLEAAKQQLDDSQAGASTLQAELDDLAKADDDDDGGLFEEDDDDEEEKAKEKARIAGSLKDKQELVSLHSEKVSRIEAELQLAEAQSQALNDKAPMERVMKKTSRKSLWNSSDYAQHMQLLNEAREVLDMNSYLNLIKEGNEAIKKKELPILATASKNDTRKRSRRFDRDYYRTCVAEGLRSICYKFLLPPNRVGIKLEEQARTGGFDFSKTMPKEMDGSDDDAEGGPMQWVPKTISQSPTDFANELIGSGELVLLSSTGGNSSESSEDPLRGCRYVAALELASEPRVRRHLRTVYRRNAMLTTKPTKKGMEELDAFHDYYGLHLIRNKPTSEHFPMDPVENAARIARLTPAERHEFDTKLRQSQVDSCLQYLNVLKAAQSGYISVHVHLPLNDVAASDLNWYRPSNKTIFARSNQNVELLLSELEKVYFPHDGDTDEWNEERKNVLRFALNNFLLPQFEAELLRELREVSNRIGVRAAAENLRTLAMEGPYRPDALNDSESRFIVPTIEQRIIACCPSLDNREASYMAFVSENGKADDFLAIPGGTQIHHNKMREKIIMFLIQHRPDAVIVGTSGGLESRQWFRRMKDFIQEAKERWIMRDVQGEDEDDDAFRARRDALEALGGRSSHDRYDEEEEEADEWKCNADIVEDKVAQLFGRSVRGKKEFPDFPVNHRCAIALARHAKDPLAELTYTWSVASDAGVFGTEMLYLNIHSLQQLLPRTMLLREYERVLCDVTAEVGADVNATCQFDHLRGLLMFIPGLGPRKAANLQQMVADSAGAISRRRDLLEDRLMGPVVYNNAVAFLQIHQTDQLVDQHLHPLDNTRLHPAIYIQHDWAVKIAFDALERENVKSKANKALSDAMADSQQDVERLLDLTQREWEARYGGTLDRCRKEWDPRVNVPLGEWRDKVGDLDLEAFANAIESKGHGRWNSHFEMLLWEFRLPFIDPRKPMESLTGDSQREKLFELITGENDKTLRPGKEVTGKVVNNGDFGTRVKLEGDIPAFIPLRNLADDHVESAEDIVSTGQIVTAIVTEVKKDHMTVDMSLRMDDFRREPSSWERPPTLTPLDPHFDLSASNRIDEDNKKKREAHIEALQVSLGRSEQGEGSTTKKNRLSKRACTHPAFRNAKNDEVMKELREAGSDMVGQALIRPSSKLSDSLAVHWVVKEGTIKIIEVQEEDKETDASVGNILKIKDEEYGSIDELLGRYIEPMNDLVEELQSHRKFIDLAEDEVDDKLKAEKKANPRGIPYAMCWTDMHAGYASLRFVASSNPRSHLIGITPKGFTWGSRNFMTLEQLINDFKKNPRGTSSAKKPVPSGDSHKTSTSPAPPKVPASKAGGRWGAKPAAPPGAPPAWQRPPPPPMASKVSVPPPPVQAWNNAPMGGPPPGPPVGGGYATSIQPPPRPPPRPPVGPPAGLPPPPSYVQPPGGPPRPPHQAPRPPPPPQQLGYGQQQPPNPPPRPPPGQPPAFDAGPPAGGPIGRGRGRTMPAWMTKQS